MLRNSTRALIMLSTAAWLSGCNRTQEPENLENLNVAELIMEESATQENGFSFDIPSDPRARYLLLKIETAPQGNIIATTRRDGPSGRSYARREIDCSNRLYRYLGEGDSLKEASLPRPYTETNTMSELVPGSITDVVVDEACAKAGR